MVSKTTGTYNLGSTALGYLGVYQSAGASYTFSWLGNTSATASYTLMVPTATGVNGQALVTNGSGVLAWKPMAVDTSAKAAAYVITDTDGIRTVLVTTGGSNRDITLPTAADNTNRIITVKKVDAGGATDFAIVKSDAAGETIDGVSGTTGIYLNEQYDFITVQCDGSDWHIIENGVKNRYQVNVLTADYATDDSDISDLTFSGLTIGKQYRASAMINFAIDSASDSIQVKINAGANNTGTTFAVITSTEFSAADTTMTNSYTGSFTANSTTLYFYLTSASEADSLVRGNNTRAETHVTLEELNNTALSTTL